MNWTVRHARSKQDDGERGRTSQSCQLHHKVDPQFLHLRAPATTIPPHSRHFGPAFGNTATISQPMGPSRSPRANPNPARFLKPPINIPTRPRNTNTIKSSKLCSLGCSALIFVICRTNEPSHTLGARARKRRSAHPTTSLLRPSYQSKRQEAIDH